MLTGAGSRFGSPTPENAATRAKGIETVSQAVTSCVVCNNVKPCIVPGRFLLPLFRGLSQSMRKTSTDTWRISLWRNWTAWNETEGKIRHLVSCASAHCLAFNTRSAFFRCWSRGHTLSAKAQPMYVTNCSSCTGSGNNTDTNCCAYRDRNQSNINTRQSRQTVITMTCIQTEMLQPSRKRRKKRLALNV